MNEFGFVRITCATPRTGRRRPRRERRRDPPDARRACATADVSLFPELCVTGYTCADLFGQPTLLDAAIEAALAGSRGRPRGGRRLVVVGLPLAVGNSLYNAAAAISDGAVLGVVPKQYLPNYKEFYEARWFAPATATSRPRSRFGGGRVPFGIDLLFDGRTAAWSVGVEICEDLWMPIPPSSLQALAGATVLLNLSASNETIGKSDYRTRPGASASRAAASRRTPTPARGRRSRRPTWSSAAIA